MRIRSRLITTLAGLMLAFASVAARAQALEQGRLLLATQVLNDLHGTRDQGIPQWLLQRAYAIAVIPGLTKVAFFLGVTRGHGVLVARGHDGRFSSPVFVTLTGGSFGFQWGVQKTDLVLVFTSPKGVLGLAGGRLTLGADASVAAGPVGRRASAATVQTFNAAVYSYSHSRGLFAGVALDGAELTVDDDANARFYHRQDIPISDILSGSVSSSDETASRFLSAVYQSTGGSAAASGTPSTAPAGGAAAKRAPAAQVFPLEDHNPGSSPAN